ncbi:MAG TPA: HD domain-containing protein [bacterium]|nr:HD domain-containing protein [bacterium]HPN44505.1 HD domain-containing protein [bacterium]
MIAEFKPGQAIEDFFVLRKAECRKQAEKGELYLSLELGDASGRIFGTLWKQVDEMLKLLKEGDIVKVKGQVIEWKGKLHLSVEKIRLAQVNDRVDSDSLIPAGTCDPQENLDKIFQKIGTVEDENLRSLLLSVYNDKTIRKALLKAPAGKLWHHCYEGGLLEHTLGVCNFAESIAMQVLKVDRQLLIAGALLHDIGKIREYKTGYFIDYSDEGRLLGHISIGYHIVAGFIERNKKFPEELANKVLHLILSHQGELEHGSPVVPMCRESLILYYADELDSKLNAFDRIYDKEKSQHKKWSSYVKLMDRFLYFGDDPNLNAMRGQEK